MCNVIKVNNAPSIETKYQIKTYIKIGIADKLYISILTCTKPLFCANIHENNQKVACVY